MNCPLYISRRLSLSSSGHKSTPAVKVAVAAVAISIAVMLASIAIVLGFKNEITAKITGFNSHITLYSLAQSEADADANIVQLTPALRRILDDADYITSYSLEVSMPVILKTESDFKGVYLRGLGEGADMDFLQGSLVDGKMPAFGGQQRSDSVIVSQMAADQLGLKVGGSIDTYFITDDVRVRKLAIAGIFNTHFENYDDALMFGDIRLLQGIAGLNLTEGTSIKVMTNDFKRLDENTVDLHSRLARAMAAGKVDKAYMTENAHVQGANYFQWLNLLDTNVIVVLILMVAVACITLISGMLIIIIDKTRFIGIVRSLGMSNRSLGRVFIYLSIKVALWGLMIGNALMITLLVIQDKTHFIPLDADSYYFDFVPVSLDWQSFALLNAATVAVIFLTLLLPSRFVSRISPARAMRYE